MLGTGPANASPLALAPTHAHCSQPCTYKGFGGGHHDDGVGDIQHNNGFDDGDICALLWQRLNSTASMFRLRRIWLVLLYTCVHMCACLVGVHLAWHVGVPLLVHVLLLACWGLGVVSIFITLLALATEIGLQLKCGYIAKNTVRAFLRPRDHGGPTVVFVKLGPNYKLTTIYVPDQRVSTLEDILNLDLATTRIIHSGKNGFLVPYATVQIGARVRGGSGRSTSVDRYYALLASRSTPSQATPSPSTSSASSASATPASRYYANLHAGRALIDDEATCSGNDEATGSGEDEVGNTSDEAFLHDSPLGTDDGADLSDTPVPARHGRTRAQHHAWQATMPSRAGSRDQARPDEHDSESDCRPAHTTQAKRRRTDPDDDDSDCDSVSSRAGSRDQARPDEDDSDSDCRPTHTSRAKRRRTDPDDDDSDCDSVSSRAGSRDQARPDEDDSDSDCRPTHTSRAKRRRTDPDDDDSDCDSVSSRAGSRDQARPDEDDSDSDCRPTHTSRAKRRRIDPDDDDSDYDGQPNVVDLCDSSSDDDFAPSGGANTTTSVSVGGTASAAGSSTLSAAMQFCDARWRALCLKDRPNFVKVVRSASKDAHKYFWVCSLCCTTQMGIVCKSPRCAPT